MPVRSVRSYFGSALLLGISAVLAISSARAESAAPSALVSASNGWSRDDAAHLLRRAAFSGTPDQISRVYALGKAGAVEYLLTGTLPTGMAAPFDKAEFKPLILGAGVTEDEIAKQAAADADRAKRDSAQADKTHTAAAEFEKGKLAALKTTQSARAAQAAELAKLPPLPLPPKPASTAADATRPGPATAPAATRSSPPAKTAHDPKAAAQAAAAKAALAKATAARDAAVKALAKAQAAEDGARLTLLKAQAAREAAAEIAAEKSALHHSLDLLSAAAKKKAQDAKRDSGINYIRNWWIDRMIRTDRPLEEKMTLFWHGLFCSGLREVHSADQMGAQNLLFHQYALGNYKALAHAILHDPAMLRYLNNDQNLKDRPNENLARELCELFTMGEGRGYTEHDIGEIARALTGAMPTNGRGGAGIYVFAEDKHDDTPKTIFGHTADYKPDDVIDLIFDRPEPSAYLARRLWEFFAYPDPSPEDLAPVIAALRTGNFELVPALRALFNSPAFYSPHARFALVKSPVDHIVSTVRLLQDPSATPAELTSLGNVMITAGQTLFQPPNVRGWPGGDNWITSATLYTRYNAAAALADGSLTPRLTHPAPKPKPAPATAPATSPATAPTSGPATATTVKVKAPRPAPPPIFAPVSPAVLFASLGPSPAPEQVVDAAIERLLQRPLSAAKRRAVGDFFGTEPVKIGDHDSDDRIIQLLALLMSTPEYQMQ